MIQLGNPFGRMFHVFHEARVQRRCTKKILMRTRIHWLIVPLELHEGHSEIIETPLPLAFWTLGKIKNSAHSKVKREEWNSRSREKVGQRCQRRRREWFRTGPWLVPTEPILINQSMTASSRKAIVLLENVTELDPTNSRYPSLNYPKSRVELASFLAVII